MTKTKEFYTDYKTAAKWDNCALVLCNNIPEIDPSVYDNADFEWDDEEGNPVEIMQWYITDLNEWSKEWQEKTFDLKYTYSNLLDCYILCVPHWGTAWDGVPCKVKSQGWIDANKDKQYKY